jgi:dTDP-4-amino-4,6-dideoxygalactose transaminase
LPVTERSASQLLSLPMFAELRPAQIEAVCAAVRETFDGRGVERTWC